MSSAAGSATPRRTFPKLVIALSFPLVVSGNALLLLLVPWTAEIFYALPGFPADPLGLAGSDRTALAESGIRSIWPFGEGPGRLEREALPDGSAAFAAREIHHMEDVRDLVRASLAVWLAAVLCAGAALLALRSGGRALVMRALGAGAMLTLALMGLLLLVVVFAFEPFFDGFHALFFEGDTWKFKDHYTLRRIYPDAFWTIATVAIVLLILIQALAVGLWSGAVGRLSRGAVRRVRSVSFR